MARPRKHDRPKIVRAVCAAIATGTLVRDAAKTEGATAGQIRAWAAEDAKLSALYACAREDQAHAIAEQAIAIADGADEESQSRLEAMVQSIASADAKDKDRLLDALAQSAIQRDKIRVDARKWMASKIAPRTYGDRQEIVGPEGGPLIVKVTFANE